jgi:excisionase family DNA binding protein
MTMGEPRRSQRRIRRLVDHSSPYVTISELAEYWLVSRKQIYKQIEAGTLKAIRLGPRLLRVSKQAAIEFERSAKMTPAAPVHEAGTQARVLPSARSTAAEEPARKRSRS